MRSVHILCRTILSLFQGIVVIVNESSGCCYRRGCSAWIGFRRSNWLLTRSSSRISIRREDTSSEDASPRSATMLVEAGAEPCWDRFIAHTSFLKEWGSFRPVNFNSFRPSVPELAVSTLTVHKILGTQRHELPAGSSMSQSVILSKGTINIDQG